MDREEMKKTKHTLWLREGDFRKLAEIHPELGSSKVVRLLVASHIDKMEATKPEINLLEDLPL